MRARRAIAMLLIAHVAVACGDEQPAAPVDVEDTSSFTLAAISPVTVTLPAGMALAGGPRVAVYDKEGKPVSRVPVSFAILSGNGTVSTTLDSTGVSGIASAGSWLPSTKPGEVNQLVAYIANGSRIVFTANVVAGPPASLAKVDGDNQIAVAGSTTQRPPGVRVSDAFGNVVNGVEVQFTVTRGSGVVQRTRVVSDAEGFASAGLWTLGSPGSQSLTAAVGNVSTVFEATALSPLASCDRVTQLARGTVTIDQISSQACLTTDNRRAGVYYVAVTGYVPVVFSMALSGFHASIELRTVDGDLIGSRSNVGGGSETRLSAIVPPGTYIVSVIAVDQNAIGSYTLKYDFLTERDPNCYGMFVIQGGGAISAPRNAGGCAYAEPPTGDVYRIHLRAGQELRVHVLDNSYEDWSITVLSDAWRQLGAASMTSYYNYDLLFFAPVEGDYLLVVAPGDYGSGGAYQIEFK